MTDKELAELRQCAQEAQQKYEAARTHDRRDIDSYLRAVNKYHFALDCMRESLVAEDVLWLLAERDKVLEVSNPNA